MQRNARHELLFFTVFLILPSALLCQAEPLDAEGSVRQTLAHAKEGDSSSDVKELGWLGDASAVALTKIIGGRALEERDIEPVLLILTLSYSAPVSSKSTRIGNLGQHCFCCSRLTFRLQILN